MCLSDRELRGALGEHTTVTGSRSSAFEVMCPLVAAVQRPKPKQPCRCHPPLPPTPPTPYPTPMPTHTRPTIRRSCEGRAYPCEGRRTSPPERGESRGGHPPLARGLGDVPPVMKETSEGGRVGPTNVAMPTQVSPWRLPLHPLPLPCFPLSISRHFSPGPTAPVRPAPSQIRLVPLFRPFQLPPAGPSAPHPARACQIRLVFLCRLVRRASNPSWTAFPQARRREKNAQHNSTQLKPRHSQPPQAEGAGHALPALTALPAGCYRLPGTPLEGRTSHGR